MLPSTQWLVLVAAGLMVIACAMPWITTPGLATTLSVYDLAEWASLHPAVRAESPPLLTSFLLRVSIVWMTLALAATEFPIALRQLLVFLTAFALLPPYEFLTNMGNENYRQLLLIAVFTIIAGTGIAVLSRRRYITPVLLVIGIVCVGTSLSGALRMEELLRGFALPVSLGGGLFVYLVGGSLLLVSATRSVLQKRKQG